MAYGRNPGAGEAERWIFWLAVSATQWPRFSEKPRFPHSIINKLHYCNRKASVLNNEIIRKNLWEALPDCSILYVYMKTSYHTLSIVIIFHLKYNKNRILLGYWHSCSCFMPKDWHSPWRKPNQTTHTQVIGIKINTYLVNTNFDVSLHLRSWAGENGPPKSVVLNLWAVTLSQGLHVRYYITTHKSNKVMK